MHHLSWSIRLILVCVLLCFASSACSRVPVDPAYRLLVEQQVDIPSSGELGPGDKFSIRVVHEKALTGDYTVSTEGTVNYPYIGRLVVQHKTCVDIEQEITAGLKNGYLANPGVSCTVLEYNSKRIFILGEVNKPGPYPYRSHSSIIEAIALAGGFKSGAESNRVRLSRQVKDGKQIQVEVPVKDIIRGREKNLTLVPGDIIYVPANSFGLGEGI